MSQTCDACGIYMHSIVDRERGMCLSCWRDEPTDEDDWCDSPTIDEAPPFAAPGDGSVEGRRLLAALLDVLADLSDLTLSDCYGIEADSDAPLDVALFAWRRAGCPR